MTPSSIQLLILAGAYVCAVCIVAASVIVSVATYRSTKRLEATRSAVSRITTLEHDLELTKDLVGTFDKRWSLRKHRERKDAKTDANPDGAPVTTDPESEREDMVARFLAKGRSAS